MNIEYKETKDFTVEQIEQLFLSVEWDSGKYPLKVVSVLKNYSTVFSAWNNEELIGLVSTFDDGCMVAYTHYLLVNPKYQGKHIGKKLMELVKEYYKNYLSLVLIAAPGKAEFYQKCGYQSKEISTPMFINKM